MKKRNTDSVAKGGGSVAVARILGMAFSFLLFLLLARHSNEYAAIFRTVMTYIIVAEFLGMLGLHRWLATEIAPECPNRWPIFLAINAFTLAFTVFLSLCYIGIASAGVYAEEYNRGIYLGALAVIPSGIYACVQSALIGIGRSHLMGKINMTENVIRCVISIILVQLNEPVTHIIWVFVLTRWLVAIYGFIRLKKIFTQTDPVQSWQVKKDIFRNIAHEAPKFALIIGAFLLLRNAGLLMLPALSNAEETALHAVCYQLFDLMLVVPSVLAITSINAFANKANASNASLKKASVQLISITSMALFPLIAIAAGFGQQILHMFYGNKYLHGQTTLIVMMIAAGLMVIDQVLSQIMQAKKLYKEDMHSIVSGGLTTLLFTPTLCLAYGALGAGLALVIGALITIAARFIFLKRIFSVRLLWLSIWKQSLVSFVLFLLIFGLLRLHFMSDFSRSPFLWLIIVPIGLLAYGVGIFMMGCLKKSQIYRMRQFLFHH